ncbi:MAG: glycosyltransferase [Oscillospiraceae bacterium]|nr:glycosyltransferase [Oscillospiraceae bacterium]
MKVSLVIPAYNEADVIAAAVKEAEAFLESAFTDPELIIVNDGSTDGTETVAQKAAGRDFTRVIGYEDNRGKGAAVRTGMLDAAGDYVFFTDADRAYGFEPLRRAMDVFSETGADAVIGKRAGTENAYGGYPLLRRTASKVFSTITRLAAGMSYDTQCGFKGFTADAAKRIFTQCTTDGFAFDFEVMMIFDRLGLHAEELPVAIVNHRASKVRVLRDSFRMLRDISRIKRTAGRG